METAISECHVRVEKNWSTTVLNDELYQPLCRPGSWVSKRRCYGAEMSSTVDLATWAGRFKAFLMFQVWHETESAFDYPSTSQQCHIDIINDPINHGYTMLYHVIPLIWVNYKNSLTWNVGPFWDDFLLLTMIPGFRKTVRPWSNLPRWMIPISWSPNKWSQYH